MPFRSSSGTRSLVGRAPQLRRLDRLTGSLRGGHGGVVVLAGDPGIGKTALLARLIARVRDTTVLATSGVESETALPFAALGDLVRPLLHRLTELPGPQADALGAALTLRRPQGALQPYAICMATLTLVTAEAERRPVLLIVDDAGWVDEPSLSALLFAARRLGNDPVAMVFAVRDPVPAEFAGLDVLPLDALSRDAAGDLLETLRPGRVDGEVASQLWTATGGNPLALTEVCAGLTDDQLAGSVALPDPLPLGAGLRDAFGSRLARLSAESRTALLAVALSANPEMGTLAAPLNLLGVPPIAGPNPHPLLVAAVRQAATPSDRRRVYDALAATSKGDARAWYRAAELTGVDERAADELESAADEMRARAGYAAAARAMHRAAELTGDPELRVRRLVVAAADARLCGHLPDASTWLGEALAADGDPAVRADVALAYGWVLSRCGVPGSAHQVLTHAARHVMAADPRRSGALWCAAVNPALIEGRVREAVDDAERGVALLSNDRALPAARVLLAEALVVRGRVGEGRRTLDEQRDFLEGLDPLQDAEELAMVGLTRLWLDQPAQARAILGPVADATRRAGELGPLSRALVFSAMVRYLNGDWLIGYAEADECLRLARELREVSTAGLALVVLARYEAAQGRLADADAHLADAAKIAGPKGVHGLTVLHGSALGLRHLVAEQFAEAVAALEVVRDFADRAGMGNPALGPWEADLVEAYRMTGDVERAADQLDALERRSSLPGARAAVAGMRAVLADDPMAGEPWFRQAMSLYAEHPQPFAQARAVLGYAQILVQHGAHEEAEPLVTQAMATFRRLGAEPYCVRTMALAGGKHGPDPASLLTSLTPRELQVARAVADGMSNPEAAAALFVSRKTVETHLSSAYRKLGVRSRTQLVRYLGEFPNGRSA